MTKEEYRNFIHKNIVLDLTEKERKMSYYARAIGTANGACLDPRWKYDRHEDDYIRTIEKHGSICGSKF